MSVEVARPLPPEPVESVPSQSPAPPVMEVQKSDQVELVTPPKERLPLIERLVVVALVVVALIAVNAVMVEEAVERRPPENVRRVEVAALGNG